MNSMRALETGLSALCKRLDVPVGEGTWKRSIEKIEKRLTVLDSLVKQKAAWKKKRQFYAEAAKEFMHFKDAWRNYAAHGRDKYDEERSAKIIRHTRSFMQHLTSRIRETKPTTRL
jgi:hypothetical protein